MIEATVSVDRNQIKCGNKTINFFAGDGFSVYFFVGDDEFESLEQAIAYCMENQK